jgi:hypothetical protein
MASGLSEDLGSASLDSVDQLYRDLAGRLNSQAKLIICFGSRQSDNFHVDRTLSRLNEVSNSVPIFGALGGDFDSLLTRGFLFYNGVKYMDRVAMVLIEGNLKPKFSLFRLPENKILKRKAIVTSAEGNIIKRINDLSALDYLTTLGLVLNRKVEFSNNIPLIVEDHQRGYWLPLLITSQIKDYIVCTQDVTVNSTLGLGSLDDTDVLKSAASLTDELKWEKFDFCLIHSCQGRHTALSLDYLGEIEKIRSALNDFAPYMFCYTSGELCPISIAEREPFNCSHSLSLACCRF